MRVCDDSYFRLNNFRYNISSDRVSITPEEIRGSIEHLYLTLDMIDKNLVDNGSQKLSSIVELANLSSIVGNLLGAGFAAHSNGFYYRNGPHRYPDLVASDTNFPGIEIKTALLKNYPKGHQPKPGYYLTYRYQLTDENGNVNGGVLDTVTIWEVKFGYLSLDDFSCSNTEGDSGKTAVIKSQSLNNMRLLYLDPNIVPYRHSDNAPYKGFN